MKISKQHVNVWLLTCVGLLIAFVVPELGLGRRIAPGQSIAASVVREGVWWAIGASMIGYVLLVERRSLSSIGLRYPNRKTVLFGILAAVRPFASGFFRYNRI